MSKDVDIKKSLGCFLLLICITVALIYTALFFSSPVKYENEMLISSGGNGSKKNPIRISNEEQFASFRDSVNAGYTHQGIYFVLTNDLDLSAYNPWIPIGVLEGGSYFRGTLDARGHTISNLNCYENEDSGKYIGLFSCLSGTVVNLGIESGKVSGEHIGAIAAYNINFTRVINCYSYAEAKNSLGVYCIVGEFDTGSFADNVFFEDLISTYGSKKQAQRLLNLSRADIAAKYSLTQADVLRKWVIRDGRLALKKG